MFPASRLPWPSSGASSSRRVGVFAAARTSSSRVSQWSVGIGAGFLFLGVWCVGWGWCAKWAWGHHFSAYPPAAFLNRDSSSFSWPVPVRGAFPGVGAGGVAAVAAGVGLIIWRLGRGLGCWVFAGADRKPGQKVMPCQRGRQGLVDGGLSPVQPAHGAPRNQKPVKSFPLMSRRCIAGAGWWQG